MKTLYQYVTSHTQAIFDYIISCQQSLYFLPHYHAQGFIDCVNELLKVQTMVKGLQSDICNVDTMLASNSSELIDSHESLITQRLELKNMASTIQAIKLCIPVLEMYEKLKEEMHNKSYYSAIKILGHLEHTYLPPISSYSFASIMSQQIPKTRQTIKEISRCDLKDFLKTIREKSQEIGLNAMWQSHQTMNTDIPIEHILGRRPRNIEDGPLDFLNFAPIYRCLHIYSIIGEREDFAKEYHADRKKQADLTFKFLPQGGESDHYNTEYFCKIVGFFVIENTLLHTSQGLVTHTSVDELWSLFLSCLGNLDQLLLKTQDKPQMLLDLKLLLVLFCQTLGGYELNVTKLYKLLINLYQKYCDSLQSLWKTKFKEVFGKDNYAPLTVDSEVQLEQLMGCAYGALDKTDIKFPSLLPFSKLVPEIFTLMEEYIEASLQFATHLDLSQTEVDDLVRKSTNELLTKTLNDCLIDLIKEKNLVLSQIVQVSINTSYLQRYSHCMETFVSSKTGCTVSSTQAKDLYGLKMFDNVKEESKRQIHVKLTEKIDEFFELSRYNWTTTEVRDHPSDHMTDMLTYLKNKFKTFTQLEQSVACGACEEAGKHIADRLLEIFLDPAITNMTRVALDVLDQDVIAYEGFALDEPVKGVKNINLLIPIQKLRNVINMIKQSDYDKYIAEFNATSRGNVHPDVLARILERFLDREVKKFSLKNFSMNKNDKEMNQLLETVIRKLRTLDTSVGSGSSTPQMIARKLSRTNLNF